ncbi:MAG: hypothetical protein ACLF0G_12765 [Candidatus Brocadiia bacterium]
MPWRGPVLLLALAAPAAGGSAPGGASVLWAPARYLGGRGLDLLDILEVSVGLGPGAKADVKYGINFLGVGRVRALRMGMDGRRPNVWWEADDQVGLFPFSLLGWPAHLAGRLLDDPQLTERAIQLAIAGSLGSQTVQRKELAEEGAVVLSDVVRMWRHTRWGDSLPVGAELHAGLAGARVMLKPLQALDFAVGIVGLDLDPWLAKSPF